MHGKSKMKKAFCEPGNTSFCPPITLVSTFCFGLAENSTGEFVIKRSEENGGDVTYRNRADLEREFGSGALHPGDLKGSATIVLVALLEKLAAGTKNDGDAAKAAKTLKAFAKKMAKKGKK